MKILFLTLSRIVDITERGIYQDLLRKMSEEKHDVFIVSPNERRYHEGTRLLQNSHIHSLLVKTLNIQQTSILEKGISTFLIEFLFLRAIQKYFPEIHFDLIIYSTPPITFSHVVRFIKKRDRAVTYLLLKDIFPQNAVDLGMISKGGMLYKYFRNKEKELYSISDHIGCMSPGNVEFILHNNPQICPASVEVNPNSLAPCKILVTPNKRNAIRLQYRIPADAVVFIYGGNLGKPQNIPFLIEVLGSMAQATSNAFFIIAGSGTAYPVLKTWYDRENPVNTILLPMLPKNEFDLLIQACDVGLIFLDNRFTIPNFPSRLLSYMENKLPVIAATDQHTDLRQIITVNRFGLWSYAGDLKQTLDNINILSQDGILSRQMGQRAFEYFMKNYTVDTSYSIIINHFNHNI
jgi:glycosyltransferase involved in cell wall biosynthesis